MAELRTTPHRVVTYAELKALFRKAHQERWIKASFSMTTFLETLLTDGVLRYLEIAAAKNPSTDANRESRRVYVCGAPSAFAIALALRPRSYLSHGSALAVRGMTERSDSRIYVNQEQTPKPASTGTLEQRAIDRALKNRGRLSTYAFGYEDKTIILLNGKNTGNYGVEDVAGDAGERYPTTSISRTLVDITVRPTYGGGVQNVLDAFRRGVTMEKTEPLVEEIEKVLDAVGYIYPYHQALGFYLARAGVDHRLLKALSARGKSYDFYLDYQIPAPAFDKEWRIYYPRDLA